MRSVTNTLVNGCAAIAAFVLGIALSDYGGLVTALAGAVLYVAIVAAWEGLVLRSWSSDLLSRSVRRVSWSLYWPKQLAVWGLLGTFYLALTSMPLFSTGQFRNAIQWMPQVVAWCFWLSPVYVRWVSSRQQDPHDDYWSLGRAVLGLSHDRQAVIDLLLSWGIKLLFAPMMGSYLINAGANLGQFDWSTWFANPDTVYRGVWRFVAFCDLIVGATGYLLTLRVFGTHIRHVSRDPVEWAVTLACYWPLWPIVYAQIGHYSDSQWHTFMENGGLVWWTWVVLLIVVKVAWLFSGLAHGIRFSNLTHRGIITTGLFRWFVHPSYTLKTTMWWLLYLPMLHGDLAVSHTLSLLFVTWLYWMRGKTEERRLAATDPIYRYYLHGVRQWQSSCLPARLVRARAFRLFSSLSSRPSI